MVKELTVLRARRPPLLLLFLPYIHTFHSSWPPSLFFLLIILIAPSPPPPPLQSLLQLPPGSQPLKHPSSPPPPGVSPPLLLSSTFPLSDPIAVFSQLEEADAIHESRGRSHFRPTLTRHSAEESRHTGSERAWERLSAGKIFQKWRRRRPTSRPQRKHPGECCTIKQCFLTNSFF